MEYGWNRAIDSTDDHDQDDKASVRSTKSNLSKMGGGTYGRRGMGGGTHDRVYINDWKPPLPATMPSPLDEEAQLEALQAYVRSLVDELEQHKAVEEPMNRLVSDDDLRVTDHCGLSANVRRNRHASSHPDLRTLLKQERTGKRNHITSTLKYSNTKRTSKLYATRSACGSRNRERRNWKRVWRRV